jgi:HlyD family secretion protein
MKKNILYISFLSCICLILSACHHSNHQAYGYIEGKLTYIAAQTTGTVNEISVSRGDYIKKDQLLCTLDPYPQNTEVDQAKANLNQMESILADLEKGRRPSEIAALEAQKNQVEAQVSFAEKTLDRYKNLIQQHFIEQAQLDQASANYQELKNKLNEIIEQIKTAHLEARPDEINAAKANVTAAKAQLSKARWQLIQKMVYAPVNGLVFDVFYRPGEIVGLSQPILSILAPENIYAIFFVPETSLAQLHLNQPIHIYCDGCKQSIMANISFISPSAEFTPPVIYSEKTRVNLIYRVEAKFNPTDVEHLHPGQPMTVSYE